MPLHVGWKSICKLLNCKDRKTAKRRVKRYQIPIVWIMGHPAISDAQFEDRWNRIKKRACFQKR